MSLSIEKQIENIDEELNKIKNGEFSNYSENNLKSRKCILINELKQL